MNKTKTDADALQQVGNIWKFLDAMSLANPDEYKRFVDQVLKDGSDNNMGPPIPQMVIQTTKVIVFEISSTFILCLHVFLTCFKLELNLWKRLG